ncbi:MAG: hypothetical protein ACRD1Y_13490 [Terriglobales bacterium]
MAIALALPLLCAAQVGARKRAPDPCEARDRCMRLYQLGKAPSLVALERAYHRGCDGYAEEAIRALRLYQLGAPGGAQALLNSMPRGVGDFMSLLWMTGDGTRVTEGDMEGFYGTVYPMDELPEGGCRDGAPVGAREELRSYYADLATLSASHPKYLPGFFLASQLFGYKADWDSLNQDDGYNSVEVDPMFSRLLASQLKARPKEFKWFARWVRLGGPAFRQARAALAAQRRKMAPMKPTKGIRR